MTHREKLTEIIKKSIEEKPDYGRQRLSEYIFNKHKPTYVGKKGKQRYTRKSIESIYLRGDFKRQESLGKYRDGNTKQETIELLGDFEFEEGHESENKPYQIPDGNWKILILNDIHIPYHDLTALKTAIEYGRRQFVNMIILNGDTMDMFGLSRFTKKPNKANLRTEIEMTSDFLKQLRRIFPSEKIIFKHGNHEYRLNKYIYDKAPELYGIDSLSLPELLKFKELNIDNVASEQIMRAGKLRILHAHEYGGGGGGVNVARGFRLKTNTNVIFGHFHKTQSDFSSNLDGDVHGSWAVGCLCNLKPEYLPYNQWNHGAAIVETFEDGNFVVNNFKIIEGRIY